MNPADATLLAVWHVGLRELLLVLAVVIAISGIEDLFIDLMFFGRTLRRRLTIYRRHDRATAHSLRRANPASMADYRAGLGRIGGHRRDAGQSARPAGLPALSGLCRPVSPRPGRVGGRRCDSRSAADNDHLQPAGAHNQADCLNHLWQAVVNHIAGPVSSRPIMVTTCPYRPARFNAPQPRAQSLRLHRRRESPRAAPRRANSLPPPPMPG